MRWVVPWWGLSHQIISKGDIAHIRLLSLEQATFYFPCRLMRQFGHKQRIPYFELNKPVCPRHNRSILRSWPGYWRNLKRKAVLNPGRLTYVSDRYREWMVEADPVKRKAIYAAELAADPRNAEKEPPKRGKKPVNQKRKAD